MKKSEKKDTAGASYLIVQQNVGGSLFRKSPYKGIGTYSSEVYMSVMMTVEFLQAVCLGSQ